MRATNMCSNFGGFRCGPPLGLSILALNGSAIKARPVLFLNLHQCASVESTLRALLETTREKKKKKSERKNLFFSSGE